MALTIISIYLRFNYTRSIFSVMTSNQFSFILKLSTFISFLRYFLNHENRPQIYYSRIFEFLGVVGLTFIGLTFFFYGIKYLRYLLKKYYRLRL